MERPIKHMRYEEFRVIADKVKEQGLKIGAMFCFGEPLADKNIFEKIRYGREIGVMTNYLGLNTNCSVLHPDMYDDILETTNNITLSFVNTGDKFEELTGLDWCWTYRNAVDFIKYRDKHKPEYQIQIGCNEVKGFDRERVKLAFKRFNVEWATDAEITWGEKVITGAIDRSIMHNAWSCDGHNGAMQIKSNGDLCFCAYDVIRSETKYGNIFEDTWEEIEASFKRLWRRPSSFCLRCDFWWNYFQMVAGGWRRGDHIDASWQLAYSDEIDQFWEDQHQQKNRRYVTSYKGKEIWKFLELKPYIKKNKKVLNIGVGMGRGSKDLNKKGLKVWGLDLSVTALEKGATEGWLNGGFTNPHDICPEYFDLAISHLVTQHTNDYNLHDQLKHVLRGLKPNGVLAIQFASPVAKIGTRIKYEESLEHQREGTVRRYPEHMFRVVEQAGGTVIHDCKSVTWDDTVVTGSCTWHGFHIIKNPTREK
jgi:SAM-dependent methyltransferase